MKDYKKHFWTHTDLIEDGLGYGQFTLAHLVWIFLMIAAIVITAIVYRSVDQNTRIIIRKTIALILIVGEIVKLLFIGRSEVKVSEYLPLEICSFGAYCVILDAFIMRDTFFGQMLLILFLPAATMAIFFPTTSRLPAINFYTIHQFIFHELIVAYAMMRFANGEIMMNYPDVWRSIFTIIIIVMFIYIVDVRFNRNFMFLRSTYDNPLLNVIWNATGGGFRYTIGLICFSIFMIHVFFVIFKVIEMLLIR